MTLTVVFGRVENINTELSKRTISANVLFVPIKDVLISLYKLQEANEILEQAMVVSSAVDELH